MSFTYAGPDGASPASDLQQTRITPDGNDAAIGGNKLDSDARRTYMYHRGLVALRGADANLPAARRHRARRVERRRNFDTSGVTEWAGKALPPRVAAFQKDFITKYMDPTESTTGIDALAAQFPDITESIDLPNKTDGYQRPAMAMMAGTTAGTARRTPANGGSSRRRGPLGGNNITADSGAGGHAGRQRCRSRSSSTARGARPDDAPLQRITEITTRQGHRRQPGHRRRPAR